MGAAVSMSTSHLTMIVFVAIMLHKVSSFWNISKGKNNSTFSAVPL